MAAPPASRIRPSVGLFSAVLHADTLSAGAIPANVPPDTAGASRRLSASPAPCVRTSPDARSSSALSMAAPPAFPIRPGAGTTSAVFCAALSRSRAPARSASFAAGSAVLSAAHCFPASRSPASLSSSSAVFLLICFLLPLLPALRADLQRREQEGPLPPVEGKILRRRQRERKQAGIRGGGLPVAAADQFFASSTSSCMVRVNPHTSCTLSR